MSTLTIRIDDKLDAQLRGPRRPEPDGARASSFAKRCGGSSRIARFEDLRQHLASFAEAHGWLTDEDVFEVIS